jgi:prepilin-type N-terminal cleavage/methylation domain-containing protein
MKRRQRDGFSLVELLVVMAIIAILASIALVISARSLRYTGYSQVRPVSTLDAIFSKLDPGQIAFGAPSRMGYGETKQANLVLSETKSIVELEKTLQETGIVRGHTIKVADIMEAHLSGNDFEILPVTPEVQAISGRETTVWKWDIKPKNFGRLPLHLSVNAKIMLDGQERARAIRTFDETVYVEVAWPRSVLIFARNNWQYICSALLIPVVGWLVNRIWKSKQK